jgi:hypothetical protein
MTSICIFGSHARRTSDPFSDLDALIIGQTADQINGLSAQWKARGWNVSRFGENEFKNLVRGRSLFVQHIKQEGCIIQADFEFMKSALRNYSPKPSYASERQDTIAQLKALPTTGSGYWADLCLADITYVLFRNASILHLATRHKKYTYDYHSLVEAMTAEFRLTRLQYEALTKLRILKHAYRTRNDTVNAKLSLQLAQKALITISNQLHEAGEVDLEQGNIQDPYFRLRRTELNLVSIYDPRELDALKPNEPGFEDWTFICSPAGYPKPRGYLDGKFEASAWLSRSLHIANAGCHDLSTTCH